MVSRAERGLLADWWFTVDKLLLVACLSLIFIGIVLSLAASPPVAERIGIADTYHFVKNQAIYCVPAIVILFGVSFLDPKTVRRFSMGVLMICLVLLVATLFLGPEVKGARRWISLAGVSIQPSEFVKPVFTVVCGFLFAEGMRRRDVPGRLLAFGLLAALAGLLVLQPDFGQTMLVSIVWAALLFMSGMSWIWIGGIAATGVVGILAAYEFADHVRSRIDRFLNPESGDTFQVDTAIESVVGGGWLGRGPGEGIVKRILPDSHTDYIFAVAAEEFGIVLCLMLVSIYAFIVLRGLAHASRESDAYIRLASAGLVVLFGIQSCINMAVSLHMMPSKGMTLPFISYGGSSLLSAALTMGMLLALTRRRPDQTRYVAPIGFGAPRVAHGAA
ncbi:FtsW/RodA/SpoVE family cell cycle protein [Methylobrevis pamukkalensis]|uniref:Probable peptidoglycan glycosyltransferase FtsW n=1 Tax=Methylobrevis pamukkalensis TaxID=1439726 RepID=A0A1E3H5E5_9HYPH|nr:putative peptidoglycan glycosyltransferase FtsW [Methylobrevis pamukkalensis]ODN71559.1 Lipid II flippase FtsW [Methylobrevis pamukkalensis]